MDAELEAHLDAVDASLAAAAAAAAAAPAATPASPAAASSPRPPARVTASGLGAFFHSRCARQLWDATHPPARAPDKPPVDARTQANFNRGVAFEAALVAALRTGQYDGAALSVTGSGSVPLLAGVEKGCPVVVHSTDKEPPSGKLSVAALIHELETAACAATGPPPEGQRLVAYHHLRWRPSILLDTGDEALPYSWGVFEPDLVFVTRTEDASVPGGWATMLTVVDAKASSRAKVSHHVQVALYWLALEFLLRIQECSHVRLSHTGAVWLPPLTRGGPHRLEPIPLQHVVPLVRDFASTELARVIRADRAEAAWHYDAIACAGCAGVPACSAEAEAKRLLCLIPGASSSDAATLAVEVRKKLWGSSEREVSIEDLASALVDDRASGWLSGSAQDVPSALRDAMWRVLRVRPPPDATLTPVRLPPILDAALSGEMRLRREPCAALAPCEDQAVFITLLHNPETQGLVAWGVAVVTRSGGYCEVESRSIAGTGCADAFAGAAPRHLPSDSAAASASFVAFLARVLAASRNKRTALYVWSPAERVAVFETLIAEVLLPQVGAQAAQREGAAAMCARALITDAAAILLSESARVSMGVLQPQQQQVAAAAAAGGARAAPVSSLSQLIVEEEAPRGGGGEAAPNPSALRGVSTPRLISLQGVLRVLVAMPRADDYQLARALPLLSSASSADEGAGGLPEDLYAVWVDDQKPGGGAMTHAALSARLLGMQSFLSALRCSLVNAQPPRELLGVCTPLELPPPSEFRSRDLRRMVFMKEFEALSECTRLRDDRISGEGVVRVRVSKKLSDADIAERLGWNKGKLPSIWELEVLEGGHLLRVDSAILDAAAGLSVATPGKPVKIFMPWLLCAAPTAHDLGVLPIHTVNDIAQRENFNHRQRGIDDPTCFVGVVEAPEAGARVIAGSRPTVLVQLESFKKHPILSRLEQQGREFVLAPRFQDWALSKVMKALTSINASPDEPYVLRLLRDPYAVALTVPELRGGDLAPSLAAVREATAEKLSLLPSQEASFAGVLSHSLQLVHGPPGTGKTHFVAVSLLRIIAAASLQGRAVKVFCTGFTQSAIKSLRLKIEERLKACVALPAKADGTAACPWAHDLPSTAPRVALFSAESTMGEGDDARVLYIPGTSPIVFGTIWALQKKFSNNDVPELVDVIVIDEASQMTVPDASVVLQHLAPGGRLLVVGDHEQLAPLIKVSWPVRSDIVVTEAPVQASILECLRIMVAARAGCAPTPMLTQLLESGRMNMALTTFSQAIYSDSFKSVVPRRSLHRAPPPSAAAGWHTPGPALLNAFIDPSHAVVERLLGTATGTSGNSLVAVHLSSPASGASVDDAIALEARAVVSIVMGLLVHCSVPREAALGGEAAAMELLPLKPSEGGIFIVAPHRVQCAAVRAALRSNCESWLPADELTALLQCVDTPERMQGREAHVVVACWAGTCVEKLERELDFMFERRRLNVSITRARCAAILLVSDAVIAPPLHTGVYLTPARTAGLDYITAFRTAAAPVIVWSLPPALLPQARSPLRLST